MAAAAAESPSNHRAASRGAGGISSRDEVYGRPLDYHQNRMGRRRRVARPSPPVDTTTTTPTAITTAKAMSTATTTTTAIKTTTTTTSNNNYSSGEAAGVGGVHILYVFRFVLYNFMDVMLAKPSQVWPSQVSPSQVWLSLDL